MLNIFIATLYLNTQSIAFHSHEYKPMVTDMCSHILQMQYICKSIPTEENICSMHDQCSDGEYCLNHHCEIGHIIKSTSSTGDFNNPYNEAQSIHPIVLTNIHHIPIPTEQSEMSNTFGTIHQYNRYHSQNQFGSRQTNFINPDQHSLRTNEYVTNLRSATSTTTYPELSYGGHFDDYKYNIEDPIYENVNEPFDRGSGSTD